MEIQNKINQSVGALKRRTKSLLGATAISFSLTVLGGGNAYAEDVNINIAPQNTGDALLALAEQSSVQIMFEAELAKEFLSPAISGKMYVEAALLKLLQGTDLTYSKVSEKVFIVKKSRIVYRV